MERLCDEVLQLIFYELQDPTSLTLVSKRLYQFSQDPYFRAQYFLTRYGPSQALYHALGRGKVLNGRVLDILISSGAHFSRYLIQVAMHHYFHTQSHFIKTQWVRSTPLPVFTYFMQLAAKRYDDIPRGKGQDDGSLFAQFLNESRYPSSQKRVPWESIRDIIEKYHFFPFTAKDPIMAHFPLALAIEPRLLPYARSNGFNMDSKYRDFVFRKMFEHASASDRKAEDVVRNFKELCSLDSSMFLTRTVAAEICIEAKSNEVGYGALKQLHKGGHLLFNLSTLIQDLLKLFLKCGSVTALSVQQTIRFLFSEYPSSDPTVRLVVLLTIFLAVDSTSMTTMKSRIEDLKLGPITKRDIYNIFIHPHTDKCANILEYMRTEMESTGQGKKGLSAKEITEVVENVAARLIEFDCKGKLLKKLYDCYPSVHETIVKAVFKKHQLRLDDLSGFGDDHCTSHGARLCRDYHFKPLEIEYFWDGCQAASGSQTVSIMDSVDLGLNRDLGDIGLESLTAMIRQDELMPARNRRRISYFSSYSDFNLSHIPHDFMQVGKWIKGLFGARSSVTAVFMNHAVVNDNSSILRHYLFDNDSAPVPVTLKHFQILARLGRGINYNLAAFLLSGPDFYRSEEDYITPCDAAKRTHQLAKSKGKGSASLSLPQVSVVIEPLSYNRGKKRPRRSAAAVCSYAVPDSDDEAEEMHVDEATGTTDVKERKEKINLEIWIKHLNELLKSEQSKIRQRKKKIESESSGVFDDKNAFVKSLTAELRSLRKHYKDSYASLNETAEDEYDGDGEYVYRSTRSKRTRTTHS